MLNYNSEISVSGLFFFDTNQDIDQLEKVGVPDLVFGMSYGQNSLPLPFRYKSPDAVSSFAAVKVDVFGNVIETISLSTSLVTSDTEYHACTGSVNYSSNLSCGIYYYLINNRYRSSYFTVFGGERTGIGWDIIGSTLRVG